MSGTQDELLEAAREPWRFESEAETRQGIARYYRELRKKSPAQARIMWRHNKQFKTRMKRFFEESWL